MRGGQLSEIASAGAVGRRPVSHEPMHAGIRKSDLFLTKGVLKDASPALLASWRAAGNRLFADPVDEDLDDAIVDAVDVVVAASLTAADDYRTRWPRHDVRLVNHHVDPRAIAALSLGSRAPRDRARFAYFGELANTIKSPSIQQIVDFVPVETARQATGWFSSLADYNAHFAVRRRQYFDRHKPFLKGFTAAACGAAILIQDSEEEPRRWLPDDYPFWLRGDVTESSILSALEDMRDAFGASQWHEATEIMADIAQRTNPAAIGRELTALFA